MSAPLLAPVLQEARACIEAATELLASAARERDALLAELERIERRADALESPLVLVLLGGTGAGKSSLLNALAGAPIARVSARRPTTSELTSYHHRADALRLPAELERLGRRVAHEREPLRHKVVVDAPDFDSPERQHRERLAQALAVADVAVVVASPEKYANAELFSWLARYRGERAFAYVLNRYDLGVPEELERDLARELEGAGLPSEPIFRLSARAAFEARRAAAELPPEAGAFARFERWIEHELDRSRMARIKRTNLVAVLHALTRHLGALLPADDPQRLAGLRAAVRAVAHPLAHDVAEQHAARLEGAGRLARALEARLAVSVGGPVGLYQALRQWARGPFAPSEPPEAALTLASTPGLGGGDTGALAEHSERVQLAHRRVQQLLEEYGWRGGPPLEAEAARAALLRVRTDAAEVARRALERAQHERSHAVALAANALPLGVLGYGLYRWLQAVVYTQPLPPGWFGGVLLLAIAATVLAGRALEYWSRRRARAALARVRTELRARCEQQLGAPLLVPLERAESATRALRQRLEALEAAIGGLEGERADPAPQPREEASTLP